MSRNLNTFLCLLYLALFASCADEAQDSSTTKPAGSETIALSLVQDEEANTISVFREGTKTPILVQNAKPSFRPYIHPLLAPDGKGVLTEFSPSHHKHQTGLYWGFTNVNGRDFFHNPGEGFWKKVSAFVIEEKGQQVKWQTIYDLLDETGKAALTETQTWTMHIDSGNYVLSLEWKGEAKTNITIGKYDYGGLFLRMPWKEGIKGEVINQARQRNANAEGQRAMWVDVGLQVEGRDDLAHVTIFDHPENRGYPIHWRVDNELGIGPAPSRKDDITIKKGESEVFRHQLFVYTGTLNDLQLSDHYNNFAGNNSMYSQAEMWEVARQEGLDAKFLSPQEAVKAMTIKNGFNVNVWASEPMMTQPMAFCWDDRGRMWIAENRDYESRGHGFSNAGDSRIIILEDTNHDGTADTKKIFLENIAFPAALAVGFDGVFVGAPPNLLFVPDRNHDDKADVKDIEVRLTGWGIRDRHETLNSFHWGPDGWLYGLQGFATPSRVKKPNGKGKLYKHKDPFPEDILQGEGTDINGGVWRYHPTKDKFEVVAHGFSNPWGIDYDQHGQLFISACVIPHMWHVVQGGIYHRQGGQHFNPYVYDDIKTITNHSHRSAHGGARIYQSDAFPENERGKIFMANIHEHAVLSDVLAPKGSGYIASHGDDFMMANNAQWVGFSMEVGPDGNVYTLDWHDADICGQQVLNSETGRIFRISPAQSNAQNWNGRYDDLSRLSDKQLVQYQTSKSDWHARRARVILQSRAAQGKIDKAILNDLQTIFNSNAETTNRLRAMWALHITNLSTAGMLADALKDKNEYVRAWAIQLLCENNAPPKEALEQFVSMAKSDPSPVVRLYLSSAMQRIGKEDAWKVISNLVNHQEDAGDHNLPKMLWFALEPLAKENPARALQIAGEGKIPMLSKFVARRAVDAGALEELVKAINGQPRALNLFLEGMIEGMEGRVDLKPPPSWAAVFQKLRNQQGRTGQLSNEIAELFGDTDAAQRSLATLANENAPLDQRRKALLALSFQQRKELVPQLPKLFKDKQLRPDVIKAIASFDNQDLGKLLLDNYDKLSAAEKADAIETLSSRPTYGWLLTTALKNKQVPKNNVSANVARQLRRVVGSGFVEVWGPIDDKPRDNKEFTKYKNLMSGNSAKSPNINQGKQIFTRTCGTCHKMFGSGGNIGPDLTGSNRPNLDYLLFNILTPSAEIQDDYKMVVVTTRDGRTYSGNVVGENQRQITMRVVGQNDIVLNKSSIQSKEVTSTSMMPQGLLNNLTEEETVNLLSYLQQAAK